MWDWLEDPDWLWPTAIAASVGLALLPVGAWFWAPSFIVPAVLFGLACALSSWQYVLTPLPDLHNFVLSMQPMPKGGKALLVRLRLTLFGAVTTAIVCGLVVALAGWDLRPDAVPIFGWALAVCSLASIGSTKVAVLLLGPWRLVYQAVFDALDIWHCATKDPEGQVTALRALHRTEQQVFGWVSGMGPGPTFRADAAVLESHLPVIRN